MAILSFFLTLIPPTPPNIYSHTYTGTSRSLKAWLKKDPFKPDGGNTDTICISGATLVDCCRLVQVLRADRYELVREIIRVHAHQEGSNLMTVSKTLEKQTPPLAFPELRTQAIDASLVYPFRINGVGIHTHTVYMACHVPRPNGVPGARQTSESMSRKKREGRLLALRQNQVVTHYRFFLIVLRGACHVLVWHGNRFDEDAVAVDPVVVLAEAAAAAQTQQG